MQARIAGALERHRAQALILDLSEVHFMDSSGLRAIVQIQRELSESDGGIVLFDPTAQVRRILALTGLDRHLRVADGVDEAERLLGWAPTGAPEGGRSYSPSGWGPVLLIEDDAGDAMLVSEELSEVPDSPRIEWAQSLHEASEPLKRGVECVLLDLDLPDATGLEGLRAIREQAPDTAVIVLTGRDDRADGHPGARRGSPGLPRQGPRRRGPARPRDPLCESSAGGPSGRRAN